MDKKWWILIRVGIFSVLGFLVLAGGFVNVSAGNGDTCCFCRYQSGNMFSWLFEIACQNWLSSSVNNDCDYKEVVPRSIGSMRCNPYSVPSGCVGGVVKDYYIGHFDGYYTGDYLDSLVDVCVGNSCSVYSQNTGCSSLDDPVAWLSWINNKNLPGGVQFEYTGTQCLSSGVWENYLPVFDCVNTECTIVFGCKDVDYMPCSDLDDGLSLCLDIGKTVKCTNSYGFVENRYCCGEAGFIPKLGFWRPGKSCDDLSGYHCEKGCYECGQDDEGNPCKFCKDSSLGSRKAGTKATLNLYFYNEVFVCSDSNCDIECRLDYEVHKDAVKSAVDGRWVIYGDIGEEGWIEKDCSSSNWYWSFFGHGSDDNYGYVSYGIENCPASYEDLINSFDKPSPPEPESDCYSYQKKEWCGGREVTTVEINVEMKDLRPSCIAFESKEPDGGGTGG